MKRFPDLAVTGLTANTAVASYFIVSGVGDRADYADRVAFPDLQGWITRSVTGSVSETDFYSYLSNQNTTTRLAGQTINLNGLIANGTQGANSAIDFNAAQINLNSNSVSTDYPILRLGDARHGRVYVPAGVNSGLCVATSAPSVTLDRIHVHSVADQIGQFGVSIEHDAVKLSQSSTFNFGNGVRIGASNRPIVEDTMVTGYVRGIVNRKKDVANNYLVPVDGTTVRFCKVALQAADAPPKIPGDHASIAGNDGIGGGGHNDLTITHCRVSEAQEHNIYVPHEYGLSITSWSVANGVATCHLTANNPVKQSNPLLINRLNVGDDLRIAGAYPDTFNGDYTVGTINYVANTITFAVDPSLNGATPQVNTLPHWGNSVAYGWVDLRGQDFIITSNLLRRSTNCGLKVRNRKGGIISDIHVLNAAFEGSPSGNKNGVSIIDTMNVMASNLFVNTADGESHSAFTGFNLQGNDTLVARNLFSANASVGVVISHSYLHGRDDLDDDGVVDGYPFDDRPPMASQNVVLDAVVQGGAWGLVFDHLYMPIGSHDITLRVSGVNHQPIAFANGSTVASATSWTGLGAIASGATVRIRGSFEGNGDAQFFPNSVQLDMADFNPAAREASFPVNSGWALNASNLVGQHGLITLTGNSATITDMGNGARGHLRYLLNSCTGNITLSGPNFRFVGNATTLTLDPTSTVLMRCRGDNIWQPQSDAFTAWS